MRLPQPARYFALLLLSLVVLLVEGCKPKPTPVTCEFSAYHWPAASAGTNAPPDLTRLGGQPPRAALERMPTSLVFTDPGHVTVFWVGLGHINTWSKLVLSPSEATARSVEKPDESYPLLRIEEGGRNLVRFGFRSRLCSDLDAIERGIPCREYQPREELFVAEATCGR